MMVFAVSPYYERFVESLCVRSLLFVTGKSVTERFPGGELHTVVREDVRGKNCLVVGSAAPPDEQLLTLLMLSDALIENGARAVYAWLPFLGYARQDKPGKGESHGIALVGRLLRAAGVAGVVSLDVHSRLDEKLFGLPIVSLSPADLFAPYIRSLGWEDAVFVAPDEGAVQRTKACAAAASAAHPVAHLVKRHVDGILHLEVVGRVGQRAILVDDIIDTGQTLISACALLGKKGVRTLAVAVTHGLFSGAKWRRLFELGVKQLLVSDSCPEIVRQTHPNVRIIPTAPLVPEFVLALTKKGWLT